MRKDYYVVRNLRHEIIGILNIESVGDAVLPDQRFSVSGQFDRYFQAVDETAYQRAVNELQQDSR